MNNVVDRVPTEILSNGAVRWEQFDSNGNSLGYVYLKRADEPSVEGTKINKVLFDSIETDLNTRMLTANKASQSEATNGIDDTKYMTPLKVLQSINANALPSHTMAINTGTVNHNGTIPQTSGYSNYAYFVSLKSATDVQSGYANLGGYISFDVGVNQSTRKVTCRVGYKSSGGSNYNYVTGVANYIEIAWN